MVVEVANLAIDVKLVIQASDRLEVHTQVEQGGAQELEAFVNTG